MTDEKLIQWLQAESNRALGVAEHYSGGPDDMSMFCTGAIALRCIRFD